MNTGELKFEKLGQSTSSTTPNIHLLDQTNSQSRNIVSPTRQSRLPPLSIHSVGVDGQPVGILLQQSKDEVQEAMKHLLTEAQSAESRIQRGIETMWQRMLDILEHRSQEMEQKYQIMKNDLEESKNKVARLTRQEAALVQQNARTCMQLSTEEKIRKECESTITELKNQLEKNESDFRELKQKDDEKDKGSMQEKQKLQQQLNEKTNMLKEYQTKIGKLTEKMNKLSKDLSHEKTAFEKQQKSNSDQLSQQISENRKLALEISKLKTQLASTNNTLTTTKEENKKLESQMTSQQHDHEMTLIRINKQNVKTVQELENKISELQKELEDLKKKYIIETESLKKQLMEVHKALAEIAASTCKENGDDYVEARIRFLQHQNRQEKVKLQKDIAKRN